jgi:hypothetical protein
MKDKKTKLFVVLNEDTLEIMKDVNGKAQKFKTEKEADSEAAGRLDMWTAVSVHFIHRFIHHEV